MRATRVRPRSGWASAGALPPPSPVSSTSAASSASSPARSPCRVAAKNRAASVVALLARRLEARPALLDVLAGAGAELAHVVLALADDRRDLPVRVVEHVVQQQHGSLLGREALQQHQHRQRQRIGRLRVAGRIVATVGDDRLGQPLADVVLAAGARGAQLVDRQPGGHGGDERARRCDLLAAVERPMHPQQRFLHQVLGLGDAAEHPVGDPERDRPQLVEQSLAIGHADANPCRQLGCPGRHSSSRLALAFDAPRISVIITTPGSPASSRAMTRGTRIGFFAPSV